MGGDECKTHLPGLRNLQESLFPHEVLQARQDVHVADSHNGALVLSPPLPEIYNCLFIRILAAAVKLPSVPKLNGSTIKLMIRSGLVRF